MVRLAWLSLIKKKTSECFSLYVIISFLISLVFIMNYTKHKLHAIWEKLCRAPLQNEKSSMSHYGGSHISLWIYTMK